MGCYFVLGNHDRRLENPNEIRSLLTSQNWIDLGNASHAQSFDRGVLKVIGNERPWFPGVALDWPRSADESRETLRIAVAHSPDQFRWASRLGSHLLLTGHTHGGQVRLRGSARSSLRAGTGVVMRREYSEKETRSCTFRVASRCSSIAMELFTRSIRSVFDESNELNAGKHSTFIESTVVDDRGDFGCKSPGGRSCFGVVTH